MVVPVANLSGWCVVYHGVDYLNRYGEVVGQYAPHAARHMTYAEARTAIAAHESTR